MTNLKLFFTGLFLILRVDKVPWFMEKVRALYVQYAAAPPPGAPTQFEASLTDTDICQRIPQREATVQIPPLSAES